MAPVNKIAANNIKTQRIKHSFTQTEVADKLNMSQNAYSEMESGKRSITLERLAQVAALYNISISHLLEETPMKTIK